MANISIAILGLGRLGASVALALKRYNTKGASHQFSITGYDNRPGVSKAAEKMKVVDELVNRAFSAVREKDIVVMALPYAEVEAAYELISQDLRPGAVIVDMSPLKIPSMNWAKKHLSKDAYMVGATPILNPQYLFDPVEETERAREDLFDKGNMLLMPSASAIKDAVELAADFSTLLGAAPHFIDPYEHDGLVAATEGIPALVGLASFYMLFKSQGWTEGQRMVNPAFGSLTHHLFDTHPDDLRDTFLNNRENLLRYLDELMIALRNFRVILAENNRDAIEAVMIETSDVYDKWINRRYGGNWDEGAKTEGAASPASEMARGLMGGFLANRLLGGKKGGKEEK